ncbi:MAG: hypothetical protein F9K23_13865 [Bacteroidetes bacterium]|nr:MAG: hypothetical protein F9K23_13865 [Bacteroidota bacterium]
MNSIAKLSLLLTALFIAAVACKRSTDFSPENKPAQFTKKSGGYPPQFTTEREVDNHLKWIARGLAHWAKPQALVRGIDSVTTIPSNDSSENPISYLETLYSFGTALKDSVDSTFAVHDYDADGLASFEYDGETYYTRLYIPNQYYNLNKPFVVVADEIEKDSIPQDTVVAYKIKAGGGIDSMLITEENSEDYYIWVVNFYSLKDFDQWEAKQGDSLIRKSGRVLLCDNDGVCEPGEKYNPNCADCYPLPPQKYKLVITQMELFRDNCPKGERWINGEYEFRVTYGLYDGSGTVNNPGDINDYVYAHTIKNVSRKDVCRERCTWGGSWGGSNCPSRIHDVEYVIYDEIQPSDSNCQMPFIFYERDDHRMREYISNKYVLAPQFMAGSLSPHPNYSSRNAAYIATTINVYALWQANNHNGSFIWVGNNEAKVKIELKKL